MKLGSRTLNASSVSFAIAFVLNTPIANAIVIDGTEDALTLANALVVGSGITVTSASLSGGQDFPSGYGGYGGYGGEFDFPEFFALDTPTLSDIFQSGTFTNTVGTYGLPGPGVVLSTGDVRDYETGPNEDSGTTGVADSFATFEQDETLSQITGQTQHFDPIDLSFTFDVDDDVDTISFIGVFGSEEFPEYVETGVNDGFGMFVNGQNVAGTGEPGSLTPINIDHPDFIEFEGTELDGVLAPNGQPLLRFDVPVVPGSSGNTFRLLLADAGDSVVDTTVFLSSFGEPGASEFIPILPDPVNPTNDDGAFVFDIPEIEPGETIWFDPDVATGYVYSTDGTFASVTAPSLASVNDPDGYVLTYFDGVSDQSVTLAPGEMFVFPIPVVTFEINGIDTDLMLDPTDPNVFVTGVSFDVVGTQFFQDPIVTFVPDPTSVPTPASIVLFGVAVAGMAVGRRKTKK